MIPVMDALGKLAGRVGDLLSLLARWAWRLVVGLAAVVVGIGWLLVVVRLARAAPHLGGDDRGASVTRRGHRPGRDVIA